MIIDSSTLTFKAVVFVLAISSLVLLFFSPFGKVVEFLFPRCHF